MKRDTHRPKEQTYDYQGGSEAGGAGANGLGVWE